jgi:hypothetical protein
MVVILLSALASVICHGTHFDGFDQYVSIWNVLCAQIVVEPAIALGTCWR